LADNRYLLCLRLVLSWLMLWLWRVLRLLVLDWSLVL
jgi:hypothetical protein